MDKLLNLIGLAQKAGRLAVGEEPTGAAARARDARLILVAADAAENSVRRVRHFADAGQCLWCRIGADKDALGRAVGCSSCAMLAVTDIGFAEAIAGKLAEGDERFAENGGKARGQGSAAQGGRGARKERPHRQEASGEKNGGSRRSGAEADGKASRAAGCRGSGRKAPDRRAEPRREERKRSAVKAAARARYADSRPVKRGKGSAKKEKQ